MEHLISLLERKNLCFRSFNKLCADFISEIERGEINNLELFQRRRQGLIKVLEQLEFEIGQCLDNLHGSPDSLSTQVKNNINQLFKERDALVKSILDFDLRILAHIDRIKDETIQKLQALRGSRKSLVGYKSPLDSVEAAERNKVYDQEA